MRCPLDNLDKEKTIYNSKQLVDALEDISRGKRCIYCSLH